MNTVRSLVRSFTIGLLLSGLLSGCESAVSPLVGQLQGEFRPGLPVERAQEMLKARGTTFSRRSAAECAALVGEGKSPAQIQPQGGLCVFGKIPLGRRWYGAKLDVILQLVFDRDGKLVDANFEQIESLL